MGMYDSVMVPCPRCGTVNEFQSKGGDCMLKEYTLETAPADVLTDVNRHSPIECFECGTLYEVIVQRLAYPQVCFKDRSESMSSRELAEEAFYADEIGDEH